MASTNWTFGDEQTLAEYVPLEDFKGILEQRIGISPDNAALLMRDGQIVDVYNGAHFSVGGIWQGVKEFFGGQHAMRLLAINLKPFQIEAGFEGLSQDNVPVASNLVIDFQVNPEKSENVLGLMNDQHPLIKPDIYQRLIPHLHDRVFGTVLRQVNAADIRGNTDLQNRIQADIVQETERLFGDLGMLVRSASVSFGLNEEEHAAIARRNVDREQEMLDHSFETKKREMEREQQATEFVFTSDLAAEKLKAAGEDELRSMILNQELAFADAREQGTRVQELGKLNHEIEVLNVERRAGYTRALEDTHNEVEKREIQLRLRKLDLEIEEMETLQRLRFRKLEEEQNIDLGARARGEQLDNLRALDEMELDSEERRRRMDRDDRSSDHDRGMEQRRLDAEMELAKLKAQGSMSPEQLLAVNAGLSPDVARIFTERAKAEALGSEREQALLREMVELTKDGRVASEDQARFFMDKAMQGAQGVAQANAGATPTANPGGSDVGTAECSACHREVPLSDRFCRHCGHQMRS